MVNTVPRYRRILAIKLADIGDLLNVTPALQALRAAQPAAHIDLLVAPTAARLMVGAPYVDRVISFDKFAFDSLRGLLDVRSVARTALFLARLRRGKYDAVAIFHHYTSRWGSLKFAILSLATGAHTRAGLDNGRGHFLSLRAPDNGFGAMHEADYWLSVAALLSADAKGGWRTQVPNIEEGRQRAPGLLAPFGEHRHAPIVAIHPGAGGYSLARIWPLERFASVAKGLTQSHNAGIVIVGGPDETEAAARLETTLAGGDVRDAGDAGGWVLNLAGRTTLQETAAVIEACDLFLGNDSGPMHLAASVNTPVVAVFGPSNSRAWGPYTPPGETSKHRIVSRDLPCMPCFYRAHSLGLREGCGPRPCLEGLPPGPVLEACREALSKTVLKRGSKT